METLLDVELQLARVVSMVQQRLLSHDDLERQSSKSTIEAARISRNIERLQNSLKLSTNELALRATQFATKKDLRIQEINVHQEINSDTETEDEAVRVGEEYSGVGKKRKRECENENEDDGSAPVGPFCREKQTKHLASSMRSYARSVMKASNLNDTAEKKDFKKRMVNLERKSSIAMSRLINLLKNGEVPSMDIATSFRDATIVLPTIIATNQGRRGASRKWTMTKVKRLHQIWDLAQSNPQCPAPLMDIRLESARAALQDHMTAHCMDLLQNMQALINSTESQPRAFEADRMAGTLEKLVIIFYRDFRLYARRQRLETAPPRTEERWAHFATISNTLAHWIERALQMTPLPMLPGRLNKFNKQLHSFANKFPDRVPASLLMVSSEFAKLIRPKTIDEQPKNKAVVALDS